MCQDTVCGARTGPSCAPQPVWGTDLAISCPTNGVRTAIHMYLCLPLPIHWPVDLSNLSTYLYIYIYMFIYIYTFNSFTLSYPSLVHLLLVYFILFYLYAFYVISLSYCFFELYLNLFFVILSYHYFIIFYYFSILFYLFLSYLCIDSVRYIHIYKYG